MPKNKRILSKIFAGMILALMLCSIAPYATAQEEGIGYLWKMNIAEDLKDHNFTGEAMGVRVAGLYVKYAGYENGLYRYDFIGSFYSNTFLNGTLKLQYSNTMAWKNTRTMRWINYEGYFLLEKYNLTSNGENMKFYGIKMLFLHIHTKTHDIARGQVKYEWIPGGSLIQSFNYSLSYTSRIFINYTKPLPYIPITGSNVTYYTTAIYSGFVHASGEGYSETNNCTYILGKEINQNFSGNITMRVKMSYFGNIARRTGLVELLPIRIGMSDLGLIYHPSSVLNSSIIMATMATNYGSIKNTIYKNITMAPYSFGFEKYASKNVKMDYVEALRKNALAMYPSIENCGNHCTWATLIPVALLILVIGASIWHRVREEPRKSRRHP